MKISKSKKELARIISENGGWRDGMEWAWYGNLTNSGYFGVYKPTFNKDSKAMEAYGKIGLNMYKFECGKIPNWHQTILSREEYFHLYPAPDADGWIDWSGGECPVERGTLVDVKYANGITNVGVSALTNKTHEDHVSGSAGSLLATNWDSGLPMSGIIAYRLHKPEPTKSTAVGDGESQPPYRLEDTFNCRCALRSIPAPTTTPTLDQLLQDWRNADDYAQRKQTEADEAAAMRDERWQAVQARAGEMGVTVGRCESVVDESELVITDWRDVRRGDYVWLGDSGRSCNCPSGEYEVVEIDARDTGQPFGIKWNDQVAWPQIHERGWRFIRHP